MTALCRAICVFIIPQNAIKCNFQIQSCENPLRFYAAHKNTPPSEGNYTGGDEVLAGADLAKSPAATGVIPPFCGGSNPFAGFDPRCISGTKIKHPIWGV